MNLDNALEVAKTISQSPNATLEQLRQVSIEDPDSYIIIVRTPLGTVLQFDTNNPYNERVLEAHMKVATAQRELEEAQRIQMEEASAATATPTTTTTGDQQG